MVVQLKDPTLPATPLQPGDKSVVERGSGASAALAKVDLYAALALKASADAIVASAATTLWPPQPNKVLTYNSAADPAEVDYTPASTTAERVWMQDAAGIIWFATYAEASAALASSLAGPFQYWFPANGMTPSTTSGAAAATTETTTNKVMRSTLAFDTAADEYAQFDFWLPKAYNGSTLLAQFVWTYASGSGTVCWGIQGRAFNNDDAADQAFGTGVTISDTAITAADDHFTSVTGALTLAGTPAAQRLARFRVYRDVDGNGTAGDDNLGTDALLLGVILTVTMSNITDA